MKILVDREDIDNARECLSKIQYHLLHSQYVERSLIKDLAIDTDGFLRKMFKANPEPNTVIDLEDLMGKRMYLVTYKIYKPLGLFDSLEKAKEDCIVRLRFNNCMRPEDAVMFEIPLNFLNQCYNFVNPSRYSDEKLLYQVYLTKDGNWGANCLGYVNGFNKYNNVDLKEYYRDNLSCAGYNYLHIEETLEFSSEEAIKRIKEKMSKIRKFLD